MTTEQNNIKNAIAADYKNNIWMCGNTGLDALSGLKPKVEDFVLVTLHRRENQLLMDEWFSELNKIAMIAKLSNYGSPRFIFPMHPNPTISQHKHLLKDVDVVDPITHSECVDLIRRCKYVITDSGGIQEESAFLKKKCIVCRKVSERTEGIGTFAFMCEHPRKLAEIVSLVEQSDNFIVNKPCPYGAGNSGELIKGILKQLYGS